MGIPSGNQGDALKAAKKMHGPDSEEAHRAFTALNKSLRDANQNEISSSDAGLKPKAK